MDFSQLSLVTIHGLISYLSTKIQCGEQQDCMELYVLIINALSLVIFGQYTRKIYPLMMAMVSCFTQFIVTKEQKSKIIYTSLVFGVYMINNGFEFLISLKEGFENLAHINGKMAFGRTVFAPFDIAKKEAPDFGITQMDEENQIVREQDPFYREIKYGDFQDYDEDFGYVDWLTEDEWTSDTRDFINNIKQNYLQFKYIYNRVRINEYPFSVDGTINLMKILLVKPARGEEKGNLIRKYIIKGERNEDQIWKNRMGDDTALAFFLRYVLYGTLETKMSVYVKSKLVKLDNSNDQGLPMLYHDIEDAKRHEEKLSLKKSQEEVAKIQKKLESIEELIQNSMYKQKFQPQQQQQRPQPYYPPQQQQYYPQQPQQYQPQYFDQSLANEFFDQDEGFGNELPIDRAPRKI